MINFVLFSTFQWFNKKFCDLVLSWPIHTHRHAHQIEKPNQKWRLDVLKENFSTKIKTFFKSFSIFVCYSVVVVVWFSICQIFVSLFCFPPIRFRFGFKVFLRFGPRNKQTNWKYFRRRKKMIEEIKFSTLTLTFNRSSEKGRNCSFGSEKFKKF